MRLGKLLSAGNCFFGGNEAAAYRLNKLCLPKFNVGKNPFAPKVAAEEPAAPKAENKISVAAKISTPVPAREQKAPAQAAVKPARPGWTAKLNPFRTPEPPAQPVATQPELSLDTVKVMHNDLADADVDIVPVKSHAESPVMAPILPPARQAWEYLGESVLKS